MSAGFVSRVVVAVVTVSLMMVPDAVPAVTFTITVKLAVTDGARVDMVQVIVPVPPTAGVVHDQPVGGVIETNVVFVGTVSVTLTDAALPGPPFVTVCV